MAVSNKHFFNLIYLAFIPLVITGCGSNSSSSNNTDNTYTINTSGGLGGSNDGTGGDGNDVILNKESGSGDAMMLRGGKVDASFTSITPVAFLGTTPLNVTVNTRIDVATTAPALGIPYLLANSDSLYVSDGDAALGDEPAITGISVAAGVTLSLALNTNGAGTASIAVTNDIANKGTIITDGFNTYLHGGLHLVSANFTSAAGSSINTAGTTDGQTGGDVFIQCNNEIYNHGSITSRGSDSATASAGSAGRVDFVADGSVLSTGDINADGGDAPTGVGGYGGGIQFQSFNGKVYNSGNLSSTGGNGQSGGGGAYIGLVSESKTGVNTGEIRNTGNIYSYGGNSTADLGGNGNGFYISNSGSNILTSGNILVMGGSTTYPAANGGNGGNISLNAFDYDDNGLPAGGIEVSGYIDTSGGDAVATGTGNGGNGGFVKAYMNPVNPNTPSVTTPSTARLAFLGYSAINTSGGDGNHGGIAKDFIISNHYAIELGSATIVVAGNNINQANLTARGGNAVTTAVVKPAYSGPGGDFLMETFFYNYNNHQDTTLENASNSGSIDLSAGNSIEATTCSNGDGGDANITAFNSIENTGSITVNGSNDLGVSGTNFGFNGCVAGGIDMYTFGALSNKATLTGNGGNGEYKGGNGSSITLYSLTAVSNTGNIFANGGNADASISGSSGGDGGAIEFNADNTGVINHTGTVSYAGGSGFVAGTTGSFITTAQP